MSIISDYSYFPAFIMNHFHPLEVVGRGTQLQLVENLN